MSKVKWGILSTARIGLEKVVPAIQKGQFSEVIAIGSREKALAEKYAEDLGIPRAYGSYNEVLNDPEVQAIYIPLPNHLHVEWSLNSMEAGKHVLCEKPIARNRTEMEILLEVSEKYPDLKVMEAFMYRFHPQWLTTKDLILKGEIGELRHIQSFFFYDNRDPSDIRNIAAYGGGGLLDIGCYCVSLARFLFGTEPERAMGCLEYDPLFKIDRMASGILEFPNGTATFTCGTQANPFQHATILGTEGRIEMDLPINPPLDKPYEILIECSSNCREIVFDVTNQFTLQFDRFSEAVIQDMVVPIPLEDAYNNIKVIDGIIESHKTCKWHII